MRNGRKGEYPDLLFLLWCVGLAAFLYDRTPSGNRGCVSGFSHSSMDCCLSKTHACGVQTSTTAIIRVSRILEAIFPSWGPYIIRQQIQLLKGQVRIFSDFLTFESYRKVAWRAQEDGWPREALRCSAAPAVYCGTGECTGRSYPSSGSEH